MKKILLVALILATFFTGKSQSGQFQQLDVKSIHQIPRYNSLANATAAGARPGSLVFIYASADSGVKIRSYDNTRWISLYPGTSGITALTGDVTASGSGSVVATLATVNGNVGTFTNPSITVNAKGLITAASSGGAGWVTTGNAGTNPSTNFIGTTDDQDLILKRNSIQVARFYEDRLSLGFNAGSATTSNFIGYSAGFNANSATNSNFLGLQSGLNATNASYSNFSGQNSGNGAANASFSNFLGHYSGFGATNASYSNFLGSNAGGDALNPSYSNFLGFSSGYDADNANNSNFFGQNSGYGAANASYSNFLGYYSGYGASNASYSTLIGFRSGTTFTSNNIGSNNIIIGTNISLPNSTTNSFNFGGVIFGTGTYSTTSGNPSIIPSSSGRVGIGIVTPHSSSILDLTTTDKGFLPPRWTAPQRVAINSPANSLFGYDLDSNRIFVNANGTWKGLRYTSDPIPTSDTASSILGAEVSLTNADTWYDAVSVTLPAGTWNLRGQMNFRAGAIYSTRIFDGSTCIVSSSTLSPNIGAREASLTVGFWVSPTTTTTYKLQGLCSTASAYIKYQSYLSQPNATNITAIKIK